LRLPAVNAGLRPVKWNLLERQIADHFRGVTKMMVDARERWALLRRFVIEPLTSGVRR
jgi:hypothetical protein